MEKKNTTTINGWEYLYNLDSDVFQVKPSNREALPPTLYKYYPLNDYSIDALLHCYLYASHPYNFNDYFDCCKDIIEYDDYDEISKIFNLESSLRNYFSPDCLNDKEKLKLLQELHWQFSYSKKGIVCFSPIKDSILMWSHYAQNNGFVIEFDYSAFRFNHYPLFPIHYVEKPEVFSLKKYSLEFAELMQTALKNECWSYEQEWRMIVRPTEPPLEIFGIKNSMMMGGYKRQFIYSIKALKHIILGYRFFLVDELQVVDEKTLKVLVNPNHHDKRISILNFIISYDIPAQMATTNGLNIIGFVDVNIEATLDHFIIKEK
ncbi:MAG: DUF2971 domain-containing protein [Bacteroidales bacterium]|nr:DUF2971 domain-containing protein [Bacteroidales bacterium]